MNDQITGKDNIVKLVYLLYFSSLFLGGVPLLVAILINTFTRDGASEIELSHFKFQMGLFLKSLVFTIIGLITIPLFFIGFIIIVATYIWLLVKSIKGFDLISRGLPINEYYKKY